MVKCSLEQLKKAKTMATIAAWQSSKTALSLSSNSSLGQRLSIPPPLSPLHFCFPNCRLEPYFSVLAAANREVRGSPLVDL
ncbi:hypothetical protein ES332_A07G256500v1 [Gossypium tomentosum]|uniref:Uncharacterized protein n=1 Tax=Gossypium tomentosum TaxID=34277 RepID=A0A5D2PZJ0_GOSTO|nr:hypothetical protein ES332_A07G256500v1 [Gossypium tomentosum]